MPKKKKNKDITEMEKTSRAKYQCSQKLAELIELVNLVPPNVILPDWKKVYEQQKSEFLRIKQIEQLSDKQLFIVFETTIEECLSNLPNTFGDYIRQKAEREYFLTQSKDDNSSLWKARFYLDFYQLHSDLRKIVNYFTYWRKEGFFTIGRKGLYTGDGKLVELPKFEMAIQITETIIEIVPTGLAEAINRVDGDRIRACEICNRIFWAKRKDSETCSVSCFNALRQRRHRKRNSDVINAKRRENYQYKKGKKKNGTL